VFDDPEVKEDAVRELVIAPILKRLGYPPTGSVRVTRSKTLRNPFIRAGTRKHPVTTVPDYTIYVNDKPCSVLDAKAPTENVLAEEHVQQAYSYAVHPEVRCEEFGLCNGRELVIFSTSQQEPLLHLKFEEFDERWETIEKLLGPKYLAQPFLRRFAPDFGTALKRMGMGVDTELILMETRLNLFGVLTMS
jgi:type I site-specific restriction endonuclease